MKTRYEHVYFMEDDNNPKTAVWYCYSRRNHGLLGTIKWHAREHRYCLFPEPKAVIDCFEDINHFIDQLGEVHKRLKILLDKEAERKKTGYEKRLF